LWFCDQTSSLITLQAKVCPYQHDDHNNATQFFREKKKLCFPHFLQDCKLVEKVCGPVLWLWLVAEWIMWVFCKEFNMETYILVIFENQGVRTYSPIPSWILLLPQQNQQKGIHTCASAVQFAV